MNLGFNNKFCLLSIYLAVIFGLMAAVFWGLAPIFSKKSFTEDGEPAIAAMIYATIGSIGLLLASVVIYDFSTVLESASIRKFAPFILSGVIGTALGRILNYNGIDKLGSSINAGLVSFNPVFASLIALIFLGETYTYIQISAVFTSSIGLLIISYSGGGEKDGWKKTWLVLPLSAALAYGSGAVLRRYGLEMDAVQPILATGVNEISALFVISMYVSFKSNQAVSEVLTGKYSYLIIGGVLNSCGIMSLFASLDQGPVVIGTTLSSLSAVVTLTVTAFYMSEFEEVNREQVIGTLLTVVSVVIVVAS